MSKQKKIGILAHITALPSLYGIGDVGPEAYRFIDFLHETGQTVWQILPINPTDELTSHSPYSSVSAFAGNTLLISPELLIKEGYLTKDDVAMPLFSPSHVDYSAVQIYKEHILEQAYQRYKTNKPEDVKDFCKDNQFWLDEYALYVTIKKAQEDVVWTDWPKVLRDRELEALKDIKDKYSEDIERVIFQQYIFDKQWQELRAYAHKNDVEIMGDIPIYVNLDSADVWAHRDMFKLDEGCQPTVVAGVPPDYFSDVGQLWGNPVYDWDALEANHFEWWQERIKHNVCLFNIMRIDHFRGLVQYWEVPSDAKTAVDGCWVDVPTEKFFNAINQYLKHAVIIAEDLGTITDDVKTVMKRHQLPGMKVLQFAFNNDENNPYLPHHYTENCVVYTGTHDNNTTRGWFNEDATDDEKQHLSSYCGILLREENVTESLIRLALKSKAKYVIIPIQDILNLPQEARFNTPGTKSGNWAWRLQASELTPNVVKKLLNSF